MGSAVEPVQLGELPARSSRFLIAVSDGAIEEVAGVLAPYVAGTEIALHTCGSRGVEELQALRSRGVACGMLHPLQTVCGTEGAAALRGAAFGIAGDEPALRWARHIAARAEGDVLTVGSAEIALYHAAAVMASNYLASLIDAAQSVMAMATGGDADRARRALTPLIRTAIDNTLARGPLAALTGPIERGDIETLERHLAALRRSAPVIEPLYRAAGRHTVDLAQRKGLAPGLAQAMKAALQ